MASILYGVMGEGLGHAVRSREMINGLLAAGHRVTVVSYDRGLKYLARFYPVTAINGLSLTYQNNEVQYWPTFVHNFFNSRAAVKSLKKLSDLIGKEKIDVVVSDFEPLSAAAANLKRLPLLSLDNQHVLTKTSVERPAGYQQAYLVDRLVTRLLVMRARAYLVLSFFPCRPLSGKVFVFSPIVRQEVLTAKPQAGDHILVYLTSADDSLFKHLKEQPAKFIIYQSRRQGHKGNLWFKRDNGQNFLEDLASCRAIMATAGFSLISEALFLGKPYLAVPAQAQYEQILNAYHLAKLGYGEHHDRLTGEAVISFLGKINQYRDALSGGGLNGNREASAKLLDLIDRCVG